MPKATQTEEYANYLIRRRQSLQGRLFQIPYQLHLRSLRLGKTLDIGCGAGRNLAHLPEGSIGLDHNSQMVHSCVAQGLKALTVEAWEDTKNQFLAHFDTLLFSHVAEHMRSSEFGDLLMETLPHLKPGGRIVTICPQESGYRRDKTHIEFMDFEAIQKVFSQTGVSLKKQYSFPFPRMIGTLFPYNEFVSLGIKPGRHS